MATITLNIPEELKKQMDKMPEVNWTAVLRTMILKRTKQLKKFAKQVGI